MASLVIPGVSFNLQPLASVRRKSGLHTRVVSKRISLVLHSSLLHRRLGWGLSISSSPAGLGCRGIHGREFRGHRRQVILAASRNNLAGEENEALENINPREVDEGGVDSSNDLKERMVEKGGENSEFMEFRQEVLRKRKNFWGNVKERHSIYRQEREKWGLGLNPIFIVHKGADGKVYRVDVDEKEILVRNGIDPGRPESATKESKARSEERMELAKAHARDIESGLVSPSPLSVVYYYVGEGAATYSGLGSLVPTRWDPASSTLHYINLAAMFVPLVFVGLIVRWFLSMWKKEKEDPAILEKDRRLMQMRKLKAQMSRQSLGEVVYDGPRDANGRNAPNFATLGDEEKQEPTQVVGELVSGGRPRVDDEEFQRKVVEIQAMARKIRLEEQESAEARSAESIERKELLEQNLRKERTRAQGFQNLAKDLDDVRRLGAEDSEELDFIGNADDSGQEKYSKLENNKPSTSQEFNSWSETSQPGPAASLKPGLPTKPKLSASGGVKPRIILSAEEARARIAAKRARSSASSSSLKPAKERPQVDNTEADTRGSNPPVGQTSANGSISGDLGNHSSASAPAVPSLSPDRSLDITGREPLPAGGTSDEPPPAERPKMVDQVKKVVTSQAKSSSDLRSIKVEEKVEERAQDAVTQESKKNGGDEKGKPDEEEEIEWMRDEVLRDIVFKVQANEEAGREPFHDLNSEQERLFFKGLERKFEREGEDVKKWIKDRVENLDYGADGVSMYDPPESMELKWKGGLNKTPDSCFSETFKEDRKRILNEHQAMKFTSQSELRETPSPSSPPPRSESSAASPSPVTSSPSSPLTSTQSKPVQGPTDGVPPGSSKTETVISSSPRVGGTTFPHQSTNPSTDKNATSANKENWNHTKRWAKDLERKYQMERDPAVRALMLKIGQDLDRWITEDEIEEASRMLDRGAEGEEEYVKMHYEKIKAKIKQQREMFGREAMLSKYSEYKPDKEESELWWLNLPFVLCIGLQRTVDGEIEDGLYSLDVSATMQGVPGTPNSAYHTVAFQDRGDAQNFCSLLSTQPEKIDAEGIELVPFSPKDLYRDAKADGYKVTVIKKGQLQLSVDQPFEEVEGRILEICSAGYYEEVLRDRTIDMDSVVDEGLGYGWRPQF